MKFGDRLKALRAAAGLTQDALARRAKVPVGTIRHLEQTGDDPSWATAVRLAKALRVPLDSFVKR